VLELVILVLSDLSSDAGVVPLLSTTPGELLGDVAPSVTGRVGFVVGLIVGALIIGVGIYTFSDA
jgi:hypothetical protein